MKNQGKRIVRYLLPLLGILFWIVLWALCAWMVDKEVILPTPLAVLRRLWELLGTAGFFGTVAASLLRILGGFCSGAVVAAVLGVLCFRFAVIRALVAPAMTVIRATPVASFIILALMFLGKERVPWLICFLMVLPVVYGSVQAGLAGRDPQLCEMLQVFHVRPLTRLFRFDLPAVFPHFAAGCRTALGLAWKAGVAAEVLCTPRRAIGKNLYEAKLYLETADVFAWTMLIIVLSLGLELLLGALFERFAGKRGAAEKEKEALCAKT